MTYTVAALHRYPVKSMLGERCDALTIGPRGASGDRAYALIDATTGKVASAKHPRLWARLFECRARYVTEPAGIEPAAAETQITLPGLPPVRSGDAAATDAALSRFFGRQVHLTEQVPPAPVIEEFWPEIDGFADRAHLSDEGIGVLAPGTFFDAAPVHLLTTATLDRLAELAPDSAFDAARFRPNIVIDCGEERGFVENAWLGRTLTIGDVRLRIVIAAPRCVMTTLPQGGLPQDAGVLRAAAEHNRVEVPTLGERPCVGVYAIVTVGGVVRTGDVARVT